MRKTVFDFASLLMIDAELLKLKEENIDSRSDRIFKIDPQPEFELPNNVRKKPNCEKHHQYVKRADKWACMFCHREL